jgi:hypothetical protein
MVLPWHTSIAARPRPKPWRQSKFHRRDVIEPIEVRQRLQVGFVFDQLLGAAVKKADVRIDALDHLTVEFQYQTQYAVRARGQARQAGVRRPAQKPTPALHQTTCMGCNALPNHLVGERE